MRLDIGIDFTVNDGPPRDVVLTDWEYRLVTHCIGLYLDAAVALNDPTRPLAAKVMKKLAAAPVAEGVVSKQARKRTRQREIAAITATQVQTLACEHSNVDWAKPFDAAVGALHGTCRVCERDVERASADTEWQITNMRRGA